MPSEDQVVQADWSFSRHQIPVILARWTTHDNKTCARKVPNPALLASSWMKQKERWHRAGNFVELAKYYSHHHSNLKSLSATKCEFVPSAAGSWIELLFPTFLSTELNQSPHLVLPTKLTIYYIAYYMPWRRRRMKVSFCWFTEKSETREWEMSVVESLIHEIQIYFYTPKVINAINERFPLSSHHFGVRSRIESCPSMGHFAQWCLSWLTFASSCMQPTRHIRY